MDIKFSIEQLIKILDRYNHKFLHVHHTWKPSHNNFTGFNHQKLQDGMRIYHIEKLEWSDIGQHTTLFPDGVFLSGRDFGRSPASIKGYNENAFAVEMLGNFDIDNDKLEGEQLKSILGLVRYFVEKHGKDSVIFHREHSNKTCPGTSIDKEKLINMAMNEQMFSDVDSNAWYAKYIEKVVEAELMGGYSDGTFKPKQEVTRAELAVVLAKIIG